MRGPWEDRAVGGYIGCEKMVLVQELLVLLAVSYEGAMRGDYVLAERCGKSNPRYDIDLSGSRALDAEGLWWEVITTTSLFRR